MKVKLIAKIPAIQLTKIVEIPDNIIADKEAMEEEYQRLIREVLRPELKKKLSNVAIAYTMKINIE